MKNGSVYRRIPSYYVTGGGQISYKAFRPGEDERRGISVDRDLKTAIANLEAANLSGKNAPRRRSFLLAELDVARIGAATDAWVGEPSRPGDSHTRIENCGDPKTQQGLADIARIIQGPSVTSIHR